MTITVIIPTYNRSQCIGENLTHLAAQIPPPQQVIVVDASTDDLTERVVAGFPGVLYLRNPAGRGNTPHSRNLALQHATGEILGFLDDDAYVRPGWTENLIVSYADESVAGVAGRALNGQPGEETYGMGQIGRFLPDGRLTGNFAADPGRIIEVGHMIGCNMSWRASVVGRLGGFQDDMRLGPGCLMEETEICIRARRLGYRLIFNPAMCADHVGARQPTGKRFTPRYSYYHIRNNFAMVIRNYGLGPMAARHVFGIIWQAGRDFVRKVGGGLLYFGYSLAGLVAGLVTGIYWMCRTGLDPIRHHVESGSVGGLTPADPAVQRTDDVQG